MAAFHPAIPVAGDETSSGGAIPQASGVEEELKRAAEKDRNDFSKFEAKVHKYPAIFRNLMSKDDCYFVPRCVAIGPYHHGATHVQRAEEMKRAAGHFICTKSGHPAEEVYAKILTMAGDARSCYDHDAVSGIPQADFATMMFLDACFLLQYILWWTPAATPTHQHDLRRWFGANQESINMDIFMLENQVPWLVLDALMVFMPANVGKFISDRARSFETRCDYGDNNMTSPPFVLNESYKPAHLLHLLWYYQSGLSSVPASESKRSSTAPILPSGITSLPQSSSAIDLAEIGIKLTQNKTAKFKDMGVKGRFFCYKLFMAPLVMDDLNACYLLNMLAFEASLGKYSGAFVRSYVLLFAMLMNREEDVHELRVKGMLHGSFSDQHTLSFCKDLAELTFINEEYDIVLAHVEAYRRNRWMWISLHRYVYNNMKYIVMVLSITGVLVGIFKALFSIKRR